LGGSGDPGSLCSIGAKSAFRDWRKVALGESHLGVRKKGTVSPKGVGKDFQDDPKSWKNTISYTRLRIRMNGENLERSYKISDGKSHTALKKTNTSRWSLGSKKFEKDSTATKTGSPT